jgi:hypothetical protein
MRRLRQIRSDSHFVTPAGISHAPGGEVAADRGEGKRHSSPDALSKDLEI